MADLPCCPGVLGANVPFRVTLRMLLAKGTLHHSVSSLEKGKEGEGTDIWEARVVLWTQI